ncbi:MAG: serine protease [Nanoarchaeota archaeon]
MKIARRFLLRYAVCGAVALAGLYLGKGLLKKTEADLVREEIVENLEDDFVFRRLVSATEAKSLEQVLDGQKSTKGDAGELYVDRLPSFICAFVTDEDTFDEERGMLHRSSGSGSGFIFHEGGYFFTNYHSVDEALENEDRAIFLVHDPLGGLAAPARILAHSKNYDLALGKLDLPENVIIKRTPIATNEPVGDQIIYSPVYDNIDCEIRLLSGDLLNTLAVIYKEGRVFDKSFLIPFEQLGLNLLSGRVLDDSEWEVHPSSNYKMHSGKRAFLDQGAVKMMEGPFKEGRYKPGNSGSPVFTLDNQLVGISFGVMEDSSRPDFHAVAYTGQTVIREFLGRYVDACKGN